MELWCLVSVMRNALNVTRIDELLSKVDELFSIQKADMAAEKQLDDYK